MRRLLLMFAIPLLIVSACSETTKEEIADVRNPAADRFGLQRDNEGGDR